MASHRNLNNFTGGEISPLLDARIDLQKYETSCRTMENMRPMVHGGATFRAGTLFLAAAKYNDRPCRLIPFNYSTNISYVLEVGDGYIRFYTGEGVRIAVTSGDAQFWLYQTGYNPGDFVQWQGVVYENILATPSQIPPAANTPPNIDPTHWTTQTVYEIAAPWDADEVFDVQVKNINDVMYMVHPNHPPQKLSRLTSVTFSIAPVSFRYPVLRDENITAVTMTLGATTGTTTLTASSPYFTAGMADSFFEIRHLRSATTSSIDISGSSGTVDGTAIEVEGQWTLTTTERWYGTLQLLRSTDGGVTWTIARELVAASDQNFAISGDEPLENIGQPRIQLKLTYTATGDPYGSPPWVGTPPTQYVKATALLQVQDAYVAGLVQCTSFVSSTVMNVTVIYQPSSVDATMLWSEAEFSAYRGYPRTVGLYEQRLFYAGTNSKPTTLWGSIVADFDDFRYSDNDDGAVAYQPAAAQQNPVQWLQALMRLIMGTSGEEMTVGSGNTDEALTPSNVTIRTTTSVGSVTVQPVLVGQAILFVQRQGKRIREWVEGNPYLPTSVPEPIDVTLLAEHITAPGVVQMDAVRLPDAQVFAVIEDGTLAVMAYNRDQNIRAWARYVTAGTFESIASIYGTPNDAVFTVVKRTINGVDKRFVEAFTAEVPDKQAGIYGMDCTQLVTQTASTSVYLGTALEGAVVTAVADGRNYSGLTVSSGTITLPREASYIRAGLPYTGTLQPMKLDQILANGTSQGRVRRINKLAVRFLNSLGCTYGNAQTMFHLEFRQDADALDSSPPLFTGDKPLTFSGNNDYEGDIMIKQELPFPMTVLGLFATSDVFGD